MDKKTDRGYLYIRANNPYINGIVGTDIKLTLKQKLDILFSDGISIVLHGDTEKKKQNTKAETNKEENVKRGYWEQGDMYDIGDVCSLCGYDSCIEPCRLSHCPSCHAEMKTL